MPLIEGKALFVLGVNGSGKSALMFKLHQQNKYNSKRLTAHRQIWFNNNLAENKANNNLFDQSIKISDQQGTSRYRDDSAGARISRVFYDLIHAENSKARKMKAAFIAGKIGLAADLSNIQSPLEGINELLAISNIPILISIGNEEEILASKNGCEPYNIAELSDGKRSILHICSEVLNAEPNQLFILDELERHLHRSIITPLLSSLFQKRKDCTFVIATHDVSLPIDYSKSHILLLRNCEWSNNLPLYWEVDLISNPDEITNSIKQQIIGSKKNILFIEGDYNSLDRQIYQLIYPSMTIMPQGGCKEVEKAVEGIRETEKLHWINAFGLVDADNRTTEQINKLLIKGVVALNCYSVESLYYRLEIIKRIAERYAAINGEDGDILFEKATSEIISNIIKHKKRLYSRLCEKKIRSSIVSQLPDHKYIQDNKLFHLNLNLKEILEKEENYFDKLVVEQNFNGLISRYPVRETQVLTEIAAGISLSRKEYESSVRKLIIDDETVKDFYKDILEPLTILINN